MRFIEMTTSCAFLDIEIRHTRLSLVAAAFDLAAVGMMILVRRPQPACCHRLGGRGDGAGHVRHLAVGRSARSGDDDVSGDCRGELPQALAMDGKMIRNHWRRDTLWGEDRSRTRRPTAMANLALLRNTLLALLPEHCPDRSLPELFKLFSASPAAALRLLRAK